MDTGMTRETKIGLLLGLGVILLIGIILSDQIAQREQGDPADFTGFASEAQQSIDSSDAPPPNYPGSYPGSQPAGGPVQGGPAEVPDNFYIPDDVREAMPQRQAMDTQIETPSYQPPTAYNVDEPQEGVIHQPQVVDVPTLTVGGETAEPPAYAQRNMVEDTERSSVEYNPVPTGTSVIRHKVVPGESLSKIARRYYGEDNYWRAIALANPGKVSADGQVNSGVVLQIPKRDDAELGQHVERIGSERVRPVGIRDAAMPNTVTIKSGDTLSELASKHMGSASRWDELLEANKDKLDSPEDLRVGMKLRIPGTTSVRSGGTTTASANTPISTASSDGKTYTVKSGDNLTEIAEKTLGNGERWRDIFEANRDKLDSADRLVVGQTLRIPS